MRRPGFLADAGLGTKASLGPYDCASRELCFEPAIYEGSDQKGRASCKACPDGADAIKACDAEVSACKAAAKNQAAFIPYKESVALGIPPFSPAWYACGDSYEDCLTISAGRAPRRRSPLLFALPARGIPTEYLIGAAILAAILLLRK